MSAVPQTLSPVVAPDLSTLQTAAALQRHQEWVSQPEEIIASELSSAGFRLQAPVIRAHLKATQAYVAVRDNDVVIAFRGSGGDSGGQTFLNALTDLNIRRVKPSAMVSGKLHWDLQVHKGFYEDYLEIRDAVWAAVKPLSDHQFYCTGFSLGSALATLCAFDLRLNHTTAVTYHGAGTPRVGNQHFKQRFNRTVPAALRLAFVTDPVPRVPLYSGDSRGFLHVGRLLELEADGSPVPVGQISGRLFGSKVHLSDHNRDKYAACIGGLIEKFKADASVLVSAEGTDPLAQAAKAEQRSLR